MSQPPNPARKKKPAPTSIVLADDHAVVRQGLRALLEAEDGLAVVGEAADGLSAIEAYLRQASEHETDKYRPLTQREREIFHLSAEGLSNQETADKLFIDKRTVETHRRHIYKKLGIHNQAELVRYALARGILSL